MIRKIFVSYHIENSQRYWTGNIQAKIDFKITGRESIIALKKLVLKFTKNKKQLPDYDLKLDDIIILTWKFFEKE